jgi:hypothetical protein
MKAKKSLLAASAIAVLGLSALTALRANSTYAAANSSNLINRFAERFNLNRDEVQSVFDEHRSSQMAERGQIMQDRLAQAVTDGKITQAQADLLLVKHTEMQTFMASLTDKTMEERREAMQTKRDEMRQWAQENNIPLQNLAFGMTGRHGQMGSRMGMGFHRFGK